MSSGYVKHDAGTCALHECLVKSIKYCNGYSLHRQSCPKVSGAVHLPFSTASGATPHLCKLCQGCVSPPAAVLVDRYISGPILAGNTLQPDTVRPREPKKEQDTLRKCSANICRCSAARRGSFRPGLAVKQWKKTWAEVVVTCQFKGTWWPWRQLGEL